MTDRTIWQSMNDPERRCVWLSDFDRRVCVRRPVAGSTDCYEFETFGWGWWRSFEKAVKMAIDYALTTADESPCAAWARRGKDVAKEYALERGAV